MTPEDVAGGLRLCRLSQWNQLEEDWRCFLESPAGGGWLDEKDGAVVGRVTPAYPLRVRPSVGRSKPRGR